MYLTGGDTARGECAEMAVRLWRLGSSHRNFQQWRWRTARGKRTLRSLQRLRQIGLGAVFGAWLERLQDSAAQHARHRQVRVTPFITGGLPLSYSGNAGVNGVSDRGGAAALVHRSARRRARCAVCV